MARRERQPAIDRVAVVGTGLSGLVCARTLRAGGVRVAFFEKSRGAGGRMATRLSGGRHFDHGAQYFTARDSRFAEAVEHWREAGVAAVWAGRVARLEGGRRAFRPDETVRWVGTPGMNAVGRHLAADLEVRYATRVAGIEPEARRWRLTSEEGVDLGCFDAVVVAVPAAQAAALLAEAAPGLSTVAARVPMAPCWAAMVAFDAPLELDFDAAFVRASPLSWIARNASKPDRPPVDAWVLHGAPAWSRQHLEFGGAEAAAALLGAFEAAIGGLPGAPAHLDAHRWRYALPEHPLAQACLFDPALRIGACGDWCGGPRVEGAFLSGRALARALLEARGPGRGPPPGRA